MADRYPKIAAAKFEQMVDGVRALALQVKSAHIDELQYQINLLRVHTSELWNVDLLRPNPRLSERRRSVGDLSNEALNHAHERIVRHGMQGRIA